MIRHVKQRATGASKLSSPLQTALENLARDIQDIRILAGVGVLTEKQVRTLETLEQEFEAMLVSFERRAQRSGGINVGRS